MTETIVAEALEVWVVELLVSDGWKISRVITAGQSTADECADFLMCETGWKSRVRPATLTFKAPAPDHGTRSE